MNVSENSLLGNYGGKHVDLQRKDWEIERDLKVRRSVLSCKTVNSRLFEIQIYSWITLSINFRSPGEFPG